MTGSSLVQVEGVGKCFKLYPSPGARLTEWLSLGRWRRHESFWALKDVSFEIARGEGFGIIGANGSGKTTLLKLLSRVLHPTEGRLEVRSNSIYSLLELGTGFHPDLTGRQNVYQAARLLRLPESLLNPDVVDRIEAFADIGEYFDRPFRFYSSGMQVRLGFAMWALLDPELLIVDEALSVGDVFFQQKSFARIEEMLGQGTCLLFVSHDMDAVRKLCRRALLLHQGRVAFLGTSEEAINRYGALVGHRRNAEALSAPPTPPAPEAGMTPEEVSAGNILHSGVGRHGHGGIEIAAARVTGSDGVDTMSVPVKGTLHFDLLLVALESVRTPSTGIFLFDRFGNLVFSAGTGHKRHRLPSLEKGESLVVRITLGLNVRPGQYTFALGASEAKEASSGHAHDRREMLGPIDVYSHTGDLPFYGIAELPMECRHGVVETKADAKL